MPPASVKKSSGVVVPVQPKFKHRLLARLVYILIRAISLTLRFRWIDRSGILEGTRRSPAIYCLWHNRLALSADCYTRRVKQPSHSPGLAAMASASRDGGMLIAVLECFGVQPVRGSTSRRGPQALRELTTWARRGYDITITPDGPRGPRYKVQDGIVALAQLTGLPLVPASVNVGWKISVKSWDRFQIPLPFSRCELVFEKPLLIPREASEADREQYRLQLEQAMNNITVD
jgi:lysophospholipid acyltransferase (LPLAT)-like uncharacterized protein